MDVFKLFQFTHQSLFFFFFAKFNLQKNYVIFKILKWHIITKGDGRTKLKYGINLKN